MATWSEFSAADPSLATGIRALLQQYGPGMGYLATIRPDGGPRVHPISPVFTDDDLAEIIRRGGPVRVEQHQEIVGVRAGGAWLAADAEAGRLAVLLNRADVVDKPESELTSRGAIVLNSVVGRSPRGRRRRTGPISSKSTGTVRA